MAYIEDVIEAIDKIIRYLDTVSGLKDFLQNEMVIDAVTRNYEIIGEAANQIPKPIKDKYLDVPWRQMYGLRNFAAHEYHTIDPQIL
ncbi:MAG: HepT-like ribonuclease domain-containing protein [Cyclobacteriaceae bacterium]